LRALAIRVRTAAWLARSLDTDFACQTVAVAVTHLDAEVADAALAEGARVPVGARQLAQSIDARVSRRTIS